MGKRRAQLSDRAGHASLARRRRGGRAGRRRGHPERAFAVAVFDVAMPILDRPSAAALVRVSHPDLPIVLHTALDGTVVRRRFTDYQAFCPEPVEPDELLAKIAGLIERTPQESSGPARRE